MKIIFFYQEIEKIQWATIQNLQKVRSIILSISQSLKKHGILIMFKFLPKNTPLPFSNHPCSRDQNINTDSNLHSIWNFNPRIVALEDLSALH